MLNGELQEGLFKPSSESSVHYTSQPSASKNVDLHTRFVGEVDLPERESTSMNDVFHM